MEAALAEYQAYPKWMTHPSETKATISSPEPPRPGEIRRDPPPGQPAMFAPVRADNADDEAYYVSRGYSAGGDSSAAFAKSQQKPLPAAFEQRDYPAFGADGELIADPDAEVEDDQYPMWVGSEIAKNAAEASAIRKRLGLADEAEAPPQARPPAVAVDSEWEEFQAWKAAKADAKAALPPVKRVRKVATKRRAKPPPADKRAELLARKREWNRLHREAKQQPAEEKANV